MTQILKIMRHTPSKWHSSVTKSKKTKFWPKVGINVKVTTLHSL